MGKNSKNKTTNEKPVSLSPLNFEDAIEGLLKVKPENKIFEKDEQTKEKTHDNTE